MGEKEEKEELQCPACPKTFLCKYGLASHIETHPQLASHCALCNITLKNPQKLRLHRLIVHTEKNEIKPELSTSTIEKADSKPKVGFDDLTFVDFTVEKFPLIAKRYFEENSRVSSSLYLNFACRLCSKAFPCESSLILHTYTHSKDKCTQCPICECDYADVTEFHAHMLKHLSDKAFDDIRPSAKNEIGDEDLMPENLSKHDFLAMFLLKEEEDKAEQSQSTVSIPKKELKPVKLEKSENNTYFPKLGQVYAPGIPAMFQNFPMPQGYQPTLDDFHKMLQLATNMSMLPSMGAGLLKSGIAGQQPSLIPSPSKSQLNPSTSTPKPAHCYSPTNQTPPHHGDEEVMFAGPEKEISFIKKMNLGDFSCKYCDSVFTDYRSLKSEYTYFFSFLLFSVRLLDAHAHLLWGRIFRYKVNSCHLFQCDL